MKTRKSEMLLNLNKKDYKFINHFCEKYHILAGNGNRLMLEIFLDEYKRTKEKIKQTK
ncbi:MAG TPA: hypothetical protein VI815_04055 [Candidatus Nanoarchaeia archaeon]|nr:hypothetical protein [Candidatus Nanoarchaeia archaeon]